MSVSTPELVEAHAPNWNIGQEYDVDCDCGWRRMLMVHAMWRVLLPVRTQLLKQLSGIDPSLARDIYESAFSMTGAAANAAARLSEALRDMPRVTPETEDDAGAELMLEEIVRRARRLSDAERQAIRDIPTVIQLEKEHEQLLEAIYPEDKRVAHSL